MILLRGSKQLTKVNQRTVSTIGKFDGFHLGHQEIINYVINKSRQQNAKSVFISFEPMPREFFCGPEGPARIYPVRKKIELMPAFQSGISLHVSSRLCSEDLARFTEC